MDPDRPIMTDTVGQFTVNLKIPPPGHPPPAVPHPSMVPPPTFSVPPPGAAFKPNHPPPRSNLAIELHMRLEEAYEQFRSVIRGV